MSYTEKEKMLEKHIITLKTDIAMITNELNAANDERFRLEEKVDKLQEAIGEIYTKYYRWIW